MVQSSSERDRLLIILKERDIEIERLKIIVIEFESLRSQLIIVTKEVERLTLLLSQREIYIKELEERLSILEGLQRAHTDLTGDHEHLVHDHEDLRNKYGHLEDIFRELEEKYRQMEELYLEFKRCFGRSR